MDMPLTTSNRWRAILFALGFVCTLMASFTVAGVLPAGSGNVSGGGGMENPPVQKIIKNDISISSVTATYTVVTTADAGAGSLRQAILDANGNPGPDNIVFAIPGTGVHTINLLSALPAITDPVVINGYTQSGSSVNTISSGYASNAVLTVELSGILLSGVEIGLFINTSGCTIKGLIINKFPREGINIQFGGGSNVVEGNFIGTDPTGLVRRGNGFAGVNVWTSGNMIGGTLPQARNVICDNRSGGVLFQGGASGNHVYGNLIGAGADGSTHLGNVDTSFIGGNGPGWGVFIRSDAPGNIVGGGASGEGNLLAFNRWDGVDIRSGSNSVKGNMIVSNQANGVSIYNSSGNTIGGTLAGERNIISGQRSTPDGWGVLIYQASENTVQGNYIGTDVSGMESMPNGVGVIILTTTGTASGNIIGGSSAAARNIISANSGYYSATDPGNGIVLAGSGVMSNIVRGNYIGTSVTGNSALPNSSAGVAILKGANGNVIGGDYLLGQGNVIGGNQSHGVVIDGWGTQLNSVEGNKIGINAAGNDNMSNANDGVIISNSASSNTIGGPELGNVNVISGNGGNGVHILNAGSDNLIHGNYIGTGATGTGALPNSIFGIKIEGTSRTSIDGITNTNIVSGNNAGGISISGVETSGNIVVGNIIGLDVVGTAVPNHGIGGVLITDGSSGNSIGSFSLNGGNVISGNNGSGISITGGYSSGNFLRHNYIGVDPSGNSPRPNSGTGIFIFDAPGTIIEENVISANNGDGIGLWNSLTTGTRIYRNSIGVGADGITALGNSAGEFGGGIAIRNYTSNNTIGGSGEGRGGNIIAYNSPGGIVAYSGNGNIISTNSIFENGNHGIDLGGNGITPNDAGDADGGANNLQNFPVIDFAASDLEAVAGTISSTPSTTFTIEIFRSPAADPSGNGEGKVYIGRLSTTTDASGNGSFFATFPGRLTGGEFITATATDPSGNTSEFSKAVSIAPRVKVFGAHYVVNTTLSGIPLHWPDGKASYTLSTSIPPAFTGAIGNSLAAWDALPQMQYTNGGSIASNNWGGIPDGLNNIAWIPTNWESTTGATANTIAVTRVRYNAITGEMTDVDIAFDAEHFTWSTIDDTASTSMNVQNVGTHEAGHFSGLGDIYNPTNPGYVSFMGLGNENVTMFGLIRDGEIKKKDLDAPDIAGIDYIYSHLPQSRVDLVLVFDGSATYASTYQSFTPSKNSATELIKKMRNGDRVSVVRLPSSVAYPLTTINGDATRNAAIAAISSLVTGGKSAIGSGLQSGQSQLSASPDSSHAKAMILFSAGEEDTLPTAFSVLPSLASANTHVYTLGFSGSSGQTLSDSIASRTRGAYFLTSSTTIGTIVDQIWTRLIGQQLLAETLISSNNVPGFPQPGLKWQGAVDPGTGSIEPGLKWQGSSFILTLITPGNVVIDSAAAAANPSDGIDFFSGPTFNFFRIKNPQAGKWTLSVQGREFPPQPEPLNLYIVASTDLTMQVAFDKAIYAPDELIGVSAILTRGGETSGDAHVVGGTPISDATVVAKVLIPGTNTSQPLTLVHSGNGVYKGTFTNTSKSGSYKFDFNASKPNDFSRQATQSVFVVGSFVCPSNIITNADSGLCSAVVNYTVVPGNPLIFPNLNVVCTPPSGSSFPVGVTTVTCIGSDSRGHRDTCQFTVKVVDNQPPRVTGISANPNVLRPPNHRMINITVGYSTADNCGSVTSDLSVVSNEPINGTGDGDTAPDWIIIDSHHVQLRSERAGIGNGRIYTITITCTDGSGNRTIRQVLVVVPKNNKNIADIDPAPYGDVIPDRYALGQNFPNPFNPTTQIEYALPMDSRVTLRVYNTLGEVVATVVDGFQQAGYRSAEFDARMIASGMYFYRIEATSITDPIQSFTQVRKMILLK